MREVREERCTQSRAQSAASIEMRSHLTRTHPEIVFSHLLTMISDEGDHCRRGEVETVELVEHLAHQAVDVAHRGVESAPGIQRLGGLQRLGDGLGHAGVPRDRGGALGKARVLWRQD